MTEDEILRLVENSSFKDWNEDQKNEIRLSIIDNLKILRNKKITADYYLKSYDSFKSIYKKLEISLKDWDGENYKSEIKIINKKQEKSFDELITSHAIRRRILKLRKHLCEICCWDYKLHKLYSENKLKNIPLEIHHKDGDKFNNKESNLQLLCPNCHSMTNNFRAKNVTKQKVFLSDEQAKDVRNLHKQNISIEEISKKFNVHYQTIVKILNYDTH